MPVQNKTKLTIAQQIAAWKEKHEKVYAYTADGKNCYLKKPDRVALGAAAVVGKTNPIKYNEILIENCWLGGDDCLKEEDKYFLGLSGKIAELVEIKEGELKEL